MVYKLAPASLFALLTAAVLAVPALAQTPTDDVYSGFRDEVVSNGTGTASAAGSAAGSGSSIPFTGFEVVLVVLAGLIVIATGLLVRRASRSH